MALDPARSRLAHIPAIDGQGALLNTGTADGVLEFDGQTTGGKHFFIPFGPPSHGAAGSAADLVAMDGAGHPFHFDVIDVRGRTVVVLVGSLVLAPEAFTAFLAKADVLLQSLRFPG